MILVVADGWGIYFEGEVVVQGGDDVIQVVGLEDGREVRLGGVVFRPDVGAKGYPDSSYAIKC